MAFSVKERDAIFYPVKVLSFCGTCVVLCVVLCDLTDGYWRKSVNVVYKQERIRDKTLASRVNRQICQKRRFLYITTWHIKLFLGHHHHTKHALVQQSKRLHPSRESFFSFSWLNGHAHTPRGAFLKGHLHGSHTNPHAKRNSFPTRGPVFCRNLLP